MLGKATNTHLQTQAQLIEPMWVPMAATLCSSNASPKIPDMSPAKPNCSAAARIESTSTSAESSDEAQGECAKVEFPKDTTTLMVRNLPRGLGVPSLLRLFRQEDSFDFLHVPYNTRLKSTNCVAFINFVSPEAAVKFHKEWDGRYITETCKKAIVVSVADKQGMQASLDNLRQRNSVPLDKPEFVPAIFAGTKRVEHNAVLALITSSPSAPSVSKAGDLLAMGGAITASSPSSPVPTTPNCLSLKPELGAGGTCVA